MRAAKKAALLMLAGGLPVWAATFATGPMSPHVPSAVSVNADGPGAGQGSLQGGPGGIGIGRGLSGGAGLRPGRPGLARRNGQTDEQLRQADSQEWPKVLEFLKQNSPNRYLVVLNLNPKPGSSYRLHLVQIWLSLEEQRVNQPDLYKVRLQQFTEEDVVIGVVADLKLAKSHGDKEGIERAEAQVNQEALKLVDLSLTERDLRITALEKSVKEERAKLQKDTAGKRGLIDTRARNILGRADMTVPEQDGSATEPTTNPAE